MAPEGETVRSFVGNFLKEKLDNFLHKNPETADALQSKIQRSEEREKSSRESKRLPENEPRKVRFTTVNCGIVESI